MVQTFAGQQQSFNSLKHNIIDHISELAFDWWSIMLYLTPLLQLANLCISDGKELVKYITS